MAQHKDYGLIGVGNSVQLGKQGPKVVRDGGSLGINVTDEDGVTAVTVSGANATSSNHFVTKAQLDSVALDALVSTFEYNSSTVSMGTIDTGTKTIQTVLTVDTAFDGNTVVSVGTDSNNTLLMSAPYNDLSATGDYITVNTVEFSTTETIKIFVTQGNSTVGNGTVVVSVLDGPVNGYSGSSGSGIALTDLSVSSNSPSGNGSLSYSNTTGVFTFTPSNAIDSFYSSSTQSVFVGDGAGLDTQGNGAVAIGEGAGNNIQGNQAIAIGRGSGNYLQGNGAVGIGFCAGATEQGDYAIAIGFKAARGNMDSDGTPNQPANSIMINASNTALNGNQAGLYINPVREDTSNTAKAIYYNVSTKELTYANAATGGGLPLANGNTSFNIATTDGNATITVNSSYIWNFDTDGYVNSPANGRIGDVFGESMIGLQANVSDSNSYASLVNSDGQNAVDAYSGGVRIITDDDAQGGSGTNEWDFDRSGNITFPNGTVQSTAYTGFGDANVVSLLSNLGSNSITTTGNINAYVDGYEIGYRNIPQVSWSGNVTLALTDSGKHYYTTSASNISVTVPANANVAFAIGDTINLMNQSNSTMTVDLQSGVTMYLAGNSTSSTRTISGYGVASLTKVASDTWFITGVGVS